MAERGARKRFGQNFLRDANVIARILRAIDPRPGQRLVEIGPGRGAMTFPLLETVGAMTAIEIDRDLVPLLRAAAPAHGRLDVVEADVLTVDFGVLAAGERLRVVGNLPYNISTPVLFHLLDRVDVIADMHFMLQREVVERMAAPHGDKTYGRLSVALQARCRVEKLFRVMPGSFWPVPKVESAIVRLVPLHDPAREALAAPLDRVLRAAFAQRRKTLSNALDGVLDAVTIASCGVRPEARAEQVDVSGFLRLAHAAERIGLQDSASPEQS
ncbi:MAG: 16S rRNA (adenine(1518)-N(6)/adenine(1519)-N(6))-dimethyltransferase RsmA [Xanthomonadales bacterium]|nr:Ribosomal RNA small subunit methyltransferase A [Xanthomonadales bacterium]MCC6594449.1 16S rRNA (adenine(1518)-N(6)/adenine(1519)-N(6))-dimethyltransferase RsmA [Xanthomonadales bacterium]